MGEGLKRRLLDRIAAEGPLSFAAYMEAALYDEEEGFFTRAPVGREFVTAPHLSPVFGALVARIVMELGDAVGPPLTVVDLGAGDGTLARQMRHALPDVPIVCVDRSPGARAALAELGFDTVASIAERAPVRGIVVANELFDNVPFHLVRRRDGRTVEVFVGADGGRLVEIEGEPIVPVPVLADGDERPVSPATASLVSEVAGALERAYVVVIDYGFAGDEAPEPVRGYAGHRRTQDLLADPGSSDVTGPVDLDALAAAARAAGLRTFGPATQRDVLMAAGYREVLDGLRERQQHEEARGNWQVAVRTFAARGDATMLVDPRALGGFRVLVLATDGLPEPRIITATAR